MGTVTCYSISSVFAIWLFSLALYYWGIAMINKYSQGPLGHGPSPAPVGCWTVVGGGKQGNADNRCWGRSFVWLPLQYCTKQWRDTYLPMLSQSMGMNAIRICWSDFGKTRTIMSLLQLREGQTRTEKLIFLKNTTYLAECPSYQGVSWILKFRQPVISFHPAVL